MTLQILFYVFSVIAVVACLMVVTSKNAVRAVLSKVLAFLAVAGVWMTLQAEYLSLLLIVVYVGAVLVMFLFVVMMIDIRTEAKRDSFVRNWPLVLLACVLLAAFLIWMVGYHNFAIGDYASLKLQPASQSDIKDLGQAMFTKYLYPFELVGMVLLAAMVAAISLTFRGKKSDNKSIPAQKQIKARAKGRVRMVKMDTDQPNEKGEK